MLNLPEVTLLGIDSFAPQRTANAMKLAMREVTFQEVALVTCNAFHNQDFGVRTLPILTTNERKERERFMVTRLSEVFGTSYCLHIEWDARLANPGAWHAQWLAYDYIGAPWRYPQRIMQWKVTKDCCVGNMGFALVSKRLADALPGLPEPPTNFVSDVHLCVGLRPALESMGMRFAPESVALKFSCEDKKYTDQFGWHGKLTARLNQFPL